MVQKYRLLILLYLMPLIACIFILPFMNSVVPVHYTHAEIDRWGSKYEYLLIALLLTVAGFLFLFFISKLMKMDWKVNKKILLIMGYAVAIVFNCLMIFFLWNVMAFS